jgi:hypothetical protein
MVRHGCHSQSAQHVDCMVGLNTPGSVRDRLKRTTVTVSMHETCNIMLVTLKQVCFQAYPESTKYVQVSIDSRNSAIHNA